MGLIGRLLGYLLALLTAVGLGLTVYTLVFAKIVENRHPPLGNFVDVSGARLHFIDRRPPAEETGAEELGRPAIVLLHGASANLRDMAISLVDPLVDAGYRVVAFDRPGHGYSRRSDPQGYDPRVQARMIRDALMSLDITAPVVVGHSWAGSIVTAYALNHGNAMAGGVVLAGATHPWRGGNAWYNDMALVPVLGHLARYTSIAIAGPIMVPGAVKANFAPNEPVPDYAQRSGLALLFRPRQFLANAQDSNNLKAILAEMSPRYTSINRPFAIVSGDADSTVSIDIHSRPLHAQVEGSTLTVLEDVGHVLHHVRRDTVVEAILDVARRASE